MSRSVSVDVTASASWRPPSERFVCELPNRKAGDRVSLGAEFVALILRYGRPGVLRGRDGRGTGYQEVREFDFASWPEMPEVDRLALSRIVHTPQWVLISANGLRAAQPVTGRWVFPNDTAEFLRLSRLPVVGEVNQ